MSSTADTRFPARTEITHKLTTLNHRVAVSEDGCPTRPASETIIGQNFDDVAALYGLPMLKPDLNLSTEAALKCIEHRRNGGYDTRLAEIAGRDVAVPEQSKWPTVVTISATLSGFAGIGITVIGGDTGNVPFLVFGIALIVTTIIALIAGIYYDFEHNTNYAIHERHQRKASRDIAEALEYRREDIHVIDISELPSQTRATLTKLQEHLVAVTIALEREDFHDMRADLSQLIHDYETLTTSLGTLGYTRDKDVIAQEDQAIANAAAALHARGQTLQRRIDDRRTLNERTRSEMAAITSLSTVDTLRQLASSHDEAGLAS